uniref:Disease resistance R13L4/SHOC-2-like LRR domain-containing protein n=1 Tax=Aegilops tauschii TaxID=37682 RepID=N1QP66_AEGTA
MSECFSRISSRTAPDRNSRARKFVNSGVTLQVVLSGIGLPEGIKKMKSIRTLRCWDMQKSLLEDIKGLGELTNLTELDLSTYQDVCLTLEQEDALVSSIGTLRDLKRLFLDWECRCSDPDSQMDSLHDPPPRLEELYLPNWQLIRVPKWIGELCCLQMLGLQVLHLSSDEVRVLGELPS